MTNLLVVCCTLATIAGCASSPIRGPVAEALELKPFTAPVTDVVGGRPPLLSMVDNVVTVEGTHGDALDVAARLHRDLEAMRIRNEIQVVLHAGQRARLAISFEHAISPAQRLALRRLVATIQQDLHCC